MDRNRSVKIDNETYSKLNKIKDATGVPVKAIIKRAVDAEAEKQADKQPE